MHHLSHRNPWGLDIRYRDWRPFLKGEDRARDDPNNSTYVPSDREYSKNGDEIDDNNHNKDKNIHPPPDSEMAQGPAVVIDIGNLQHNAGIHHTNLQQNAGVHHN